MRETGFFAACLSTQPDDLGQWRGYSEGGGYAVGFSVEHLESIAAENHFSLCECNYSRDEQEAMILGALDPPFESMVPELEDHRHRAVNRAVAEFMNKFREIAPRIKDPAFAAEQEWRLVRGPLPYREPETIISMRPGKSFPIPYVDCPIVSDKLGRSVCAVRIGPTPNRQLAEIAMTRVALSSKVVRDEVKIDHSKMPFRNS